MPIPFESNRIGRPIRIRSNLDAWQVGPYLLCSSLSHNASMLSVMWKSVQYCSRYRVNKLWCESTTNPVPVLRIEASRGFSELTKNVIKSSHGHSTPFLKISCKFVQPFSRNLANKETKKQRYKHINKEIDRNNTPSPDVSGTG